jgi:hypothetical protein
VVTIKVLPNSNVSFFYRLKVIEVSKGNVRNVDILFPYDTSKTVILNRGNDAISFHGILSTTTDNNGDTLNILDIYAKPNNKWENYFIRVDVARATMRSDLGYDDFYAYRSITLLDNQTFQASLSANVNETVERPVTCIQVSSSSFTVPGNSTYKLYLTVTGLSNDSVVNATTSAETPSEFVYNIEYSSVNTLLIKIRNIATYSKDFPALNWNISFRKIT